MTIKADFLNELEIRYRSMHPTSERLHKEACDYLPGGDTRTATFFRPFPHYISKGEGAFIFDADGNRLLDFQNNYTSLIHGHAHPPTVAAIKRQIALGSAFTAPIELQTKLAKIIVDRFPSVDLVRFTNSGTEANMHALRIARAYTGKVKIIKTEGGYHGTTDVFEASVDPNLKKAGSLDSMKALPESRGVSKNALKDVLVAPFNDIERTRKVIEENYKETACLIVEPIMGSAGQITPTMEYLHAIRDMTNEYQMLLIFDEVVTARLSLGGAQKLYEVYPDLTTFGKIIGGGVPIGAFGGRRDIMSLYDPRERKMYHSGTFNGNAISMVAGIATMEDFDQIKIDKINNLGKYFVGGARHINTSLGLNIQMNGVGSLYNIVFSNKEISNYRDMAGSHEGLNEILFLLLLTKGVFNAPRGMFCLSTAMTQADIDWGLSKLKESLEEMYAVIKEVAPELIVE